MFAHDCMPFLPTNQDYTLLYGSERYNYGEDDIDAIYVERMELQSDDAAEVEARIRQQSSLSSAPLNVQAEEDVEADQRELLVVR